MTVLNIVLQGIGALAAVSIVAWTIILIIDKHSAHSSDDAP